MEYIKNKCSSNVSKVEVIHKNIKITVYFDKHYFDRLKFGDKNGKRDGINIETVLPLVCVSLDHLIYYALQLKGFAFIDEDTPSGKHLRIIIQKESDTGELLNIVTETHLISLDEYEITIITAMTTNNFFMADGQHIIELFNETESYLKIFSHQKLQTISEL